MWMDFEYWVWLMVWLVLIKLDYCFDMFWKCVDYVLVMWRMYDYVYVVFYLELFFCIFVVLDSLIWELKDLF